MATNLVRTKLVVRRAARPRRSACAVPPPNLHAADARPGLRARTSVSTLRCLTHHRAPRRNHPRLTPRCDVSLPPRLKREAQMAAKRVLGVLPVVAAVLVGMAAAQAPGGWLVAANAQAPANPAASAPAVPAALAGGTLVEFSNEARFQLDVKVPEAALAAYLPPGWTPNVAPQGPAKDCNLRVIFIDRITINGPDGKPVGKGSNRLVYLAAPVKEPGGTNVQL